MTIDWSAGSYERTAAKLAPVAQVLADRAVLLVHRPYVIHELECAPQDDCRQ